MKEAHTKQAVTFWLQTLNTGFLYAGIQASGPRWKKRFSVTDDYTGVCCTPSVTHVSFYIHQIQSKVPAVIMNVTFFFQNASATQRQNITVRYIIYKIMRP
jgi:hypothetical protein